MKWEDWNGCLISSDKRVLKAESIDKFPPEFKRLYEKGYLSEEYEAKITEKARYADPYSINGKYNFKNEFIGLSIEREGEKVVIRENLIKRLIQKSSKFYLSSHLTPVIIQNKNYVLIVAPCCDDLKVIEYLPLN